MSLERRLQAETTFPVQVWKPIRIGPLKSWQVGAAYVGLMLAQELEIGTCQDTSTAFVSLRTGPRTAPHYSPPAGSHWTALAPCQIMPTAISLHTFPARRTPTPVQ